MVLVLVALVDIMDVSVVLVLVALVDVVDVARLIGVVLMLIALVDVVDVGVMLVSVTLVGIMHVVGSYHISPFNIVFRRRLVYEVRHCSNSAHHKLP